MQEGETLATRIGDKGKLARLLSAFATVAGFAGIAFMLWFYATPVTS